MMAERPDQSLPQQTRSWADLKAAYRLLSNPAVDPQQIGRSHQAVTRHACQDQGLVLCVQDDCYLEAARLEADRHLQHSTLAVLPQGDLLGMLDQRFFERPEPPVGETRSQRMQRWRESCVWSEAVQSVGRPPRGCRFLHVMDRAGDEWEAMQSCRREESVGFLIRAQHNRRVEGGTTKLWPHLRAQGIAGRLQVQVSTQKNLHSRASTRRKREASVSVRFTTVRLETPRKWPTRTPPQVVQAVYLEEESPPAGEDPIEWMLLTSEAVHSFAAAQRVIGLYERRWLVEEWHRALKEGCRLKGSQLDQPQDVQRLSAMLSILAVRLLQLRDLADPQRSAEEVDDPAALRQFVPSLWLLVVAALLQCEPEQLTPRQFWRAIAKQGGYIGRTRDPRPGWKVMWKGWYDISQMVRGAELMRRASQKCG